MEPVAPGQPMGHWEPFIGIAGTGAKALDLAEGHESSPVGPRY